MSAKYELANLKFWISFKVLNIGPYLERVRLKSVVLAWTVWSKTRSHSSFYVEMCSEGWSDVHWINQHVEIRPLCCWSLNNMFLLQGHKVANLALCRIISAYRGNVRLKRGKKYMHISRYSVVLSRKWNCCSLQSAAQLWIDEEVSPEIQNFKGVKSW